MKIVIEGPDILKTSVKIWSALSQSVREDEREEDEEKELLLSVNILVLLDLNRFGDWNKLLRVTAYVMKAVCLYVCMSVLRVTAYGMRAFRKLKKDETPPGELRNPDHEEIRLAKNY